MCLWLVVLSRLFGVCLFARLPVILFSYFFFFFSKWVSRVFVSHF